jgi:hypothetical protein
MDPWVGAVLMVSLALRLATSLRAIIYVANPKEVYPYSGV